MKAIFRPIFFVMLVLAGLKGIAQCNAPNFSYSIGTGGQVAFTDYSYSYDSLGNAPTYIWSFGDGDTVQNSGYIVNHTYAHGGTYTVSLRIVELNGLNCDSTVSQTIQLNQCQGASNWDINGYLGFGDLQFYALNFGAYSGATVLWNFGDGNTSTVANPSHQYAADGNYQVTCIVSDATFGCADTTSVNTSVVICNFPIQIYDSIMSYNPVAVDFQPGVITAGYTYSWGFGDGGTGSGSNTTHNYVASGNYAPVLTVSDGVTGCAETTSTALSVNLCGVNTNFNNGGNGLTQSFITYNFDSINGGGSNITSYVWSFPGATPSTGTGAQVYNVVYPAVGTYSACLYMTTSGGCVDTVCNSVVVSPPLYSISGLVSKNGISGFAGTVYLIVQDSIGHLALLDSMSSQLDTASNGFGYYFGALPVDTYYVKAALNVNDPDYANYLPTYYTSSLTWGTATPVYLTGNNGTVDIALTAGTNPGGPGFVAGYVTQGAGLVIGGGSNNSRSVGEPLNRVQINLLTSAGAPVAYTYTDMNGHYQFPSLALGSYKIQAEELNKIPSPLEFTLTASNPVDSGADISINSHTATGIDNINGVQISEVYPNPVIGMLQLQLNSTQNANTVIKLVDILGRTCLQQNIKLITGANAAEINMAQLTAGVYQLVLQTGSQQITYKIVKAK